FTLHTMVQLPPAVPAGVPLIVAVRAAAPAASASLVGAPPFPPSCVIVWLFPASASVAFAVIVAIATPSDPDAVAGAVIPGCRFGMVVIVNTVVVLAVSFVAPAPSFTVNTML